jgi:hypothetical protein
VTFNNPWGPLRVRTPRTIPISSALNEIKSSVDNDLSGAAREIRTPDPIITNDVLYQLSYCGPVEQGRAGGRVSNGAAVYAGLPRVGNIRVAGQN